MLVGQVGVVDHVFLCTVNLVNRPRNSDGSDNLRHKQPLLFLHFFALDDVLPRRCGGGQESVLYVSA